MNNATVDLASFTLDYLDPGNAQTICVYGIKVVGVDRDILRNITEFEFENGWVIPIQVETHYSRGGLHAIYRELVRKVETYLQFLDPMQLEAFHAPEVIEDENPDELDPFPVFVCQCCREDYEQ